MQISHHTMAEGSCLPLALSGLSSHLLPTTTSLGLETPQQMLGTCLSPCINKEWRSAAITGPPRSASTGPGSGVTELCDLPRSVGTESLGSF